MLKCSSWLRSRRMSSSSPSSEDGAANVSRHLKLSLVQGSLADSTDPKSNSDDNSEGSSPAQLKAVLKSARQKQQQQQHRHPICNLGHSSRVMFLEDEMEKLLEFSQQSSQIINDELQKLLGRFESQKGALERLMKSESQSSSPAAASVTAPISDPDSEDLTPTAQGLSDETAQLYLSKLRRLMQQFSRAVSQSSLKPLPTGAEAATGASRSRLRAVTSSQRRRIRETARPLRILDGVEALDIALVVNENNSIHYRSDGSGLAYLDASNYQAESGWRPLPRQTLYCAVSDSRDIAVVDTHGRLLTRFGIQDGESDKPGNFERLSYMRASNKLLVSDYHSLYICDLCGRAQKSLHTFSWIVGHCVDETSRRLYIADRVNEYVSVYCLDTLSQRGSLAHSGFTDGLSSVCLLRGQLLVSDRGANRIFAFNSDSLEPMYSTPLRCPLFLTTDLDRSVYVTVGGGCENAVKILDSRCRLQRKLVPGFEQFGSPGGLTVAADTSELFVCDLDNRRIQVFRL